MIDVGTEALGTVLRETDIRAGEVPGGTNLPVLSLTKTRGLVPQSERFTHRVALEDTSTYKVVHRGEIVYNPFVIWEGAIHMHGGDTGVVSPAYKTFEVLSGDPLFLDAVLKTPTVLREFYRFSSGVVQRRRAIKLEGFRKIRIPFPDFAVQQSAAAVVRTIDENRAAIVALADVAESVRQSVGALLFQRGVPNRRDDALQKHAALGLLPREWEIAPLSTLLRKPVQYGLSIAGEPVGSVPILRMNNVTLTGAIDVSRGLQYVEESAELQEYLLDPGDLLFNRTNSLAHVGKTGLFCENGRYVFASYLVRVRCDRDLILDRFLCHYLNLAATQRRLKRGATRAVAQSNINATKLERLLVPVPQLGEQAQIADAMDAATDFVRAEDSVLQSLVHVRQAAFEQALRRGRGDS